MLMLSLCHGGHDSSAVVADDYEILSAVQTERLTRIKGHGQYAHAPTAAAALAAAGAKPEDVEIFATSAGAAPADFFSWPPLRPPWKALKRRMLGRAPGTFPVLRHLDHYVPARVLRALGLPEQTPFFRYNHHFAHALPALFHTDWPDALLYTADGGGDAVYYSANHFTGAEIRELYGDRTRPPPHQAHSVGLAYGFMTEALGFRRNRHEGKLTGLAAYGRPDMREKLGARFSVGEDGIIRADFSNHRRDMRRFIHSVARETSPENAAASVQKLLEDLVLESVGTLLRKTGATRVGMAGGVFSNVSLNRKIAELPGVDEVFIFPAMGDEGLAVGGVFQFLLQRDGLEKWLSRRRRLRDVYWGGEYDDEMPGVFNAPDLEKIAGDVSENAAELLAAGKIVALFCGRMEFGPRALGARSILASPARREINDTLNRRLGRTEFMPFAPYVLEEDADLVFEIPPASRYAARFMTVTCMVRPEWREKIPAVAHVDGTARPQIVRDRENPLYAEILRKFKRRAGLPILVNTSFNAHEEPMIHLPSECLRALRDRRVDYVAARGGLWGLRCES